MATIDYRQFMLAGHNVMIFYIQQGRGNRLKVDVDDDKYEVRNTKLVKSIWSKVELYCEHEGEEQYAMDLLKELKQVMCKKVNSQQSKKRQSDGK